MVNITGKDLCKSFGEYLVFKDVSVELSDAIS